MGKALSLKQPWAWLVCSGYKDVEFRHWLSKIKGRIYIHASKIFDYGGYVWLLQHPNLPGIDEVVKQHIANGLNYGAIIGEVVIDDYFTIQQSSLFLPNNIWIRTTQGCLGDKCYHLVSPKLYDKPIPYKGKLGFFEVNINREG